MPESESERRRRRLRHPEPAPPAPAHDRGASAAGASFETSGVRDPDEYHRERAEAPADDERDPERGLRGLVGPGASQVSVSAALRARDASRPTDADLAAAQQDLVIVRRGWTPRAELPRTR